MISIIYSIITLFIIVSTICMIFIPIAICRIWHWSYICAKELKKMNEKEL